MVEVDKIDFAVLESVECSLPSFEAVLDVESRSETLSECGRITQWSILCTPLLGEEWQEVFVL